MPQFGPGDTLPVYRPRAIPMGISHFRPTVDRTTSLVADEDEAPRTNDPSAVECPIFSSIPGHLYRVSGCAHPSPFAVPRIRPLELGSRVPSIGRSVFEDVTFSTDMKTEPSYMRLIETYGIGPSRVRASITERAIRITGLQLETRPPKQTD